MSPRRSPRAESPGTADLGARGASRGPGATAGRKPREISRKANIETTDPNPPGLHRLGKKDLPRAGEVLRDAFRDDPVWTRVFEGVPDRDRKIPAFFETPLRYALAYGEVLATSADLEGVAAWMPGEFADMKVGRMLRSGALWTGLKLGFGLAKRLKVVFDPIQTDRRRRMEGRKHLYLQIVGVATRFQGRGFGGRLLRALLDRSEARGVPVYLETETERNVALYERFGFRVLGKVALPVIGVPMWEMLREAHDPSEKAENPQSPTFNAR